MNFFFNNNHNSFFASGPVTSPPLALSSPSLTLSLSLGFESSSPRVDVMEGVETEPEDMNGVELEPEDMEGIELEPEDMEGIELEPEDMEEIEIEMLPEDAKMPPEDVEEVNDELLQLTLIQIHFPFVEPYWDDDL